MKASSGSDDDDGSEKLRLVALNYSGVFNKFSRCNNQEFLATIQGLIAP